jgi:hypothetical protein
MFFMEAKRMVTFEASRRASRAFEPHSRGFWIENNVLLDRECDNLIDAVPQSLQGRSRAGARHLMSVPVIEAMAKDERLLRIARRALGDGAVPFRATLFDKSARANWLVV